MPDHTAILSAALQDPGLTSEEKSYLSDAELRKDIASFLSGAVGSAIAIVIAKYSRLSKPAQTILGLAGFGAGKLLYNALHKEGRQSSQYDDKLKVYKVDPNL